MPCTVESIAESGDEMTCRTGEKPSPLNSAFIGGQGIKFDVFKNQNDFDSLVETGEKGMFRP